MVFPKYSLGFESTLQFNLACFLQIFKPSSFTRMNTCTRKMLSWDVRWQWCGVARSGLRRWKPRACAAGLIQGPGAVGAGVPVELWLPAMACFLGCFLSPGVFPASHTVRNREKNGMCICKSQKPCALSIYFS